MSSELNLFGVFLCILCYGEHSLFAVGITRSHSYLGRCFNPDGYAWNQVGTMYSKAHVCFGLGSAFVTSSAGLQRRFALKAALSANQAVDVSHL